MGVGVQRPESPPAPDAGNTGSMHLSRAGAFAAFLTGTRYYEIRFTGAITYQLWYRDDPSAAWVKDPTDGDATQDMVFTDAKAYILTAHWTGIAAVGDKFHFQADPSAKMVEIPVLFSDVGTGGALAYTIDNVNSLVDGNTIITGQSFGPSVDYTRTGASDILQDYVVAAFKSAGYTSVLTADSRVYHDTQGSIHCGTNVIREVPTYDWWDF